MRFTTLAIVVLGFVATDSTARSIEERTAAPDPASSRPQYKKQMNELEARVKFPGLFKRQEPQQSQYLCSTVCVNNVPTVECSWVPGGPTDKKKKRESNGTAEVILEPEAAAAYLLGYGAYEHENGTSIIDYDYRQIAVLRRGLAKKRWKIHNWVRSALGNAVMDLGMPIYTRWRRHFADEPEYEFGLSSTHAFRMGDLAAIEAALLSIPDWDEFEISEWRISRHFLEVAHDLI